MTDPHPDVEAIDRTIAEADIRGLAEELGYETIVLTDGTICCEPPGAGANPERVMLGAGQRWPTHGPDGDACAKCGTPLDALNRCQNVINDPNVVGRFTLEYVCPKHLVR